MTEDATAEAALAAEDVATEAPPEAEVVEVVEVDVEVEG